MQKIITILFSLAASGVAAAQTSLPATRDTKGQMAPLIDQVAVKGDISWLQFFVGISWPLTILLSVLMFAFHPRLNRLFGLTRAIRKIKAAGVEMEINAEAVDAVRAELRASTKDLVEKAKDEYDRMAKVMRISEHLEDVVVNAVPRVLKECGVHTEPPNLRATIHVHDIVFSEYLYQLVDYFPTKRGAGRRFPQRYGIIGRSWRLGRSLGEGNAFESGKGEEQTLIEEWGMTREDVRARGKNQPAYLSVILNGIREDEFANGILYVDTTEANAFGSDETATRVSKQLEKAKEVISLRGSLEKLLQPLRLAAPNLDIRRISE